MGRILREDEGTNPAPLLEHRARNLQQVGKILVEKYNSTFVECVKISKYSAEKLLKLVVKEFECFRDEADFYGHRGRSAKNVQFIE